MGHRPRPRRVALTPGDGRLTVSFTPGSDGGSSITAIEYQLDNGVWVDTGSLNSPFTIAGLTNGTPYSVAVRARNAIGAGAASATATATPRTVPGAPTLGHRNQRGLVVTGVVGRARLERRRADHRLCRQRLQRADRWFAGRFVHDQRCAVVFGRSG